MNATVETLIEQAKALSADEREALIAALEATLPPPDAEWEAAWIAECERRMAAVERGEEKLIPAEVLMKELRSKFRSR